MEQSKKMVLDLSGKGEFCSDSQELADNFVRFYKTDDSIKKSVDLFLDKFNKDKEETISVEDIFDVYNSIEIDISKVCLIKEFFEEYFTNYNVGIYLNDEEFIGTDGDINLVKKTVLHIITSEKKPIEEIHMFVFAIKLFLIEMNCRINEILCNEAKGSLEHGNLETTDYFEELFEIIKMFDKSKHKFILMGLLQQGREIKPTIDRRGKSMVQNITELFETIEKISINKKKLLEKNLNKVMFENGALSKKNRILITKLLIINQDKINIKNFLKFKNKKKVKIKQSKKGLLEQLLPKLENKLLKESNSYMVFGNINVDDFLLFVQKEIEKKIRKKEINAANYFFVGYEINQDYDSKLSFKLKIPKKKKNILSMISEEELNNYLLMFVSGYTS